MPLQPCPACAAGTTRLLTEVSRYAVVRYYRCDACGHVWTIDKDSAAIRHVTPIDRDETELEDGQSAFVRRSHVSANWLETELRSGLALVRTAAAADSPGRERVLERVEGILRAVKRYMPQSTLTRDEARGLLADFYRLDEAFRELKHGGKLIDSSRRR